MQIACTWNARRLWVARAADRTHPPCARRTPESEPTPPHAQRPAARGL